MRNDFVVLAINCGNRRSASHCGGSLAAVSAGRRLADYPLLKIHTRNMPLADDVDLGGLATRTEGYTGADLENLVRRAGMECLRDNTETETISAAYFEKALEVSSPSVTTEMLDEYKRIHESLKQERPL